ERLQRLVVEDGHIVDAAGIAQPRMLRADARIVETGGDRMAVEDLAVLVLQKIGAVAVQHARPPRIHRGAMLVAAKAATAGLDADDLHVLVVEEGMEDADGVGAATDGG